MRSATAAVPSATSSPAASADAEDWREGGFGLYVHWPFCAAKCPYCDFNSHVRPAVDHERWQRALVREVARVAAETSTRSLRSVFFGGGTPSLMAPGTVAAVLDAAAAHWPLAPDCEITLEANPTSVEAGRFAAFAAAGINRVSLGVQALNDTDLRRLGRQHGAAEAIRALDVARARFARVSIDLIYARADQDRSAWEAELRQALAFGVDHLSLYQLTIEPGTRFGALHRRGLLRGLPDDGLAADLYEATQQLCGAAGLPAYEVSNHARPGAESRHNLVYWRYGDYAGIGPGAHGRITLGNGRFATESARVPEQWLARVETEGSGEVARERLDAADQATEMLLMGLRLVEGVRPDRYRALSGTPLDGAALAEMQAAGLIAASGERIAATPRGILVLGAVLRRLLA